MYPGTGTQVCSNMPSPAFSGPGPNNGYHPYMNGPHCMFPNYFAPPPNFGPYPHQDHRNFNPIDTRFTQHLNNQERHVFSTPPPPVGLSMPPMNTPTSYMQFDGRFPFPPPMQSYSHYPLLPPNGMMVNQFSNPPPYPPPDPSGINKNQGRNFSGSKFGSSRPTDCKFMPQKTKSFHCGSCDKDFNTASRYQQHVNLHVDCRLEGCTFRAHPLIVEKHIIMQHRSGLFKRIVKGNTPEEIGKWITDRKKQYPTLGKIVEKETQKIEMAERGERYDDQRRRPFNQRDNLKRKPINGLRRKLLSRHENFRGGSHDSRNPRQFADSHKQLLSCKKMKLDSKSDDATHTPNSNFEVPPQKTRSVHDLEIFEYRRNLPEFRGTTYYLRSQEERDEPNYSNSDSDGERINVGVASSVCEEEDEAVPIFSSLDLIRGYDSSENDDDCDESFTEEEIKPKILVVNGIDHDGPNEPDSIMPDEDNDSGPEECSSKLPVPNFILQDLTKPLNMGTQGVESIAPYPENIGSQNELDASKKESDSTITKKSTRKRTHKKNHSEKVDECAESAVVKKDLKRDPESTTIIPPIKRYRRPTLLEKLLAPEIRHERNIILQCVRYIVRNNYFDVGSKTPTAGNRTL